MIFQHAIWHFNEERLDIDEYNKIFKTEPLITKLLLDRGIHTYEEAHQFLHPNIALLHDPFLLRDMDVAVNAIKSAMKLNKSIWIYGDYDVDGITSIAVVTKCFEFLGYSTHYYIPSRQDEGYGLSEAGLEYIKAHGGDLVITVDCGITANAQAEFAKTQGIDLIITDHHECQGDLPEAVAVINPKIEGYPFKMLAGCGVAFKLTQALLGDQFESFYKEVIDIVALGTVADIVPLVDENRIFTKIGLEQMMHTKNPGIQALIEEAQLQGKEINSGHIGFIIAPRINASGRIGNPKIAVKMLLEKDYYTALSIAKELSALNAQRQEQERVIMEEAENYIRDHIDLYKEKILLVVGENWHTGIIGIVASKLTDKYSRPVVVLNVEDGLAKGSARSVDGISIFGILSHFKDLYDKFGGHEQAAGLSLPLENVGLLRERLYQHGVKEIPWRLLVNEEKISAFLEPKMVTHGLVESIESLKPFGMGNPKPQFVFNHLTVDDYRIIGKAQNHLKIIVNDGIRVYDALAFNQAENLPFFKKNEKLNLLLTLEKNEFRGVETIQFLVQDFVKARMPLKDRVLYKAHEAIFNTLCTGVPYTALPAEHVSEIPEMGTMYVYTLEALETLKDYLLIQQRLNYAIHFNEISHLDWVENGLNIIFMPREGSLPSFQFGDFIDLQAFIPTREEMVILYKWALKTTMTPLTKAVKDVSMPLGKIFAALALFEEMQIVSYEVRNDFIAIYLKDKPKEKMNIQALALYQKFTASAEIK